MSEERRRRPHFPPHTTRSRIVLEVASELSGRRSWPFQQAQVSLREPGAERWKAVFIGSDTPGAIEQVARGEVHVAVINPTAPLALAYRGRGPYKEPIPLRAIAVVPSYDQFVFAVSEKTGLKSLTEIRERRSPLRISLRGGRGDHSVHFLLDCVLRELGFSLNDIEHWGGTVRYDKGMPHAPGRMGAAQRGEVDAIFDEGIQSWGQRALEAGMRFLPVEGTLLERLEEMGFRRGILAKANYPLLRDDVPTLDFSGWGIYTHAAVPDEVVAAFCDALEARKDRIPWDGEGSLPIEKMCRDTPEGPLPIPLHPAAERYWRERGYLG
jgi:TRAP-type uncharacterized transport system substrate-binding protein